MSRQIWDAAPASPLIEVLRSYVHAAVDNHRDDPQLLQVFLEQAPRWHTLLPRVTEYHDRYLKAADHRGDITCSRSSGRCARS